MQASEALSALPAPIRERVLPLSEGPLQGDFVLVWLRTALRAHHNPTLDAALVAADAAGLPVFVYQGLSERYPYASDRHHTFILQGARDLHRDLAARGLASALHVERPGHDGPHLKTLAERAALVVTEDLPVPPLTRWTTRLRDAVQTPLWVVDAACILPMRQVPAGVTERAFRFRKATQAPRRQRLDAGWNDQPVRRPPFTPELPFEPVDPHTMDIAALVAACRIDHSVGPVHDTPGGTRAGQARWINFRDQGLDTYAKRRNNAAIDGTSRMSAYLHYGMVSPFALAADALARGSEGAEKWLDEFLIWRELAHAWCARHPDLHTLDVLPAWARETLTRHASDPREALSWETLSRGRTGHPLWDAAQTSLLRHGELHNNLRMTWGKALLRWTSSPEHARALLVDLNHRYALDGRDPCSYGGLYWCLGLFDRPFPPAEPVRGVLRPRELEVQAKRVSLSRIEARIHRAVVPDPPRVAVIGAGLAGLRCARILQDHGLEVAVFDKSRGPSGRMSTRRRQALQFDHGAQFFTARDPGFRRHVRSWLHEGVVAPWNARAGTLGPQGFRPDPVPTGWDVRFVGAPRMSALGRHLSAELDLHTGLRVTRVSADGELFAQGRSLGRFDRVVVALPAPQAAPLLEEVAPSLSARAAAAEMLPTQALMLGFAEPVAVPWDAAQVQIGPLSWIARNSAKPGRPPHETWVIHAGPEHSLAHLEEPSEDTVRHLLAAFRELTGCSQEPTSAQAHRWRYARVASASTGPRALVEGRFGVCGDWLIGPRVEAAWLSGEAVAGRLLGGLSASHP